jgi:molecular chaperone Hsp33
MPEIERDTLLRFMFENTPVRGELVHLDSSWKAVLERHDYPAPVRTLLGEMMAACALFSSKLKFSGTLTIQLQGNGPVSLMVMEATNERTLRGLAKWQPGVDAQTLPELVGKGTLAITIDSDIGKERYQGMVEIVGDSLAESLEHYLVNSEQIDTKIWLAADKDFAAGMLLQRMPDDQSSKQDETWEHVTQLANTITDKELLELPGRKVMHRLFHEEDIRLFEAEPISFRCSCSRERVAGMLKTIGQQEVRSIIEDEEMIEIGCEFCNKRYSFDKVDAEQLFAADISMTTPKGVQ